MAPKILSDKPITLESVKNYLKVRSEIAELNYIQRITFDYSHRFSAHFPESETFLDFITHEFAISREDGIQLININPKTLDEINIVMEDKLDNAAKQRLLEEFNNHREQYGEETEENLPTDISATMFNPVEEKDEEYPDEEPRFDDTLDTENEDKEEDDEST